jgi:hypothetical protein
MISLLRGSSLAIVAAPLKGLLQDFDGKASQFHTPPLPGIDEGWHAASIWLNLAI